ncbi:MAG: ATP-binding protein [Nonlabens sp.]|uniref:ATP-binding protein n=1 Tax=Nonlabens sp. TaxID=1888209 RepID=UPI00321BB4E8
MEKIPQQRALNGLKIVLFGPESTGKSTLAQQLATHFNTVKVDEYARDYLQDKFDATGKVCEYHDLMSIAIGQRIAENEAVEKANKHLFCDTDALETFIYSIVYFNKAPLELEEEARQSKYDLYLLLHVDTPWTPDDLRDKPEDRNEMFQMFEKGLKEFNKPYTIISGLGEKRFENALKAIQKISN